MATAPRASAKPAVFTATLLRGRNYKLIDPFRRANGAYSFVRGVGTLITDTRIADYLRDLTDVVLDGDDEEVEKPMFRVKEGDHVTGTDMEEAPRRAIRSIRVADEEDEAPKKSGVRRRGRAV